MGRVWIGCDPGAQGGLAAFNEQGKMICTSMLGDLDLLDWLLTVPPSLGDEFVVVVEKVSGYMPGSGGNIGSAMFSFGKSVGKLHMAVTAAGYPFYEIMPRVWQSHFGLSKKRKEKKVDWKNRLKKLAQSYFPKQKITLSTADAILLGLYAQYL